MRYDKPHRLLDMLYDTVAKPLQCPGCDQVVSRAHTVDRCAICEACRHQLVSSTALRANPSVSRSPLSAAAGVYSGVLRACLLAYKERGRCDLAAPLGDLLGQLINAAYSGPVILIPIPATRQARRGRGLDHVALLCREARAGNPHVQVVPALLARPRADSVALTVAQRQRIARQSLRPRPGACQRLSRLLCRHPETAVLLVDDIVTSGATLAAAAVGLQRGGVAVDAAVTVAATLRERKR